MELTVTQHSSQISQGSAGGVFMPVQVFSWFVLQEEEDFIQLLFITAVHSPEPTSPKLWEDARENSVLGPTLLMVKISSLYNMWTCSPDHQGK